MDGEQEFVLDQVHSLSSALHQFQQGQDSRFQVQDFTSQPSFRGTEAGQAECPPSWISDRGIMAPLVVEYDRHVDELTEKLQKYEVLMSDIKVKLERVVAENERLHAELRESVEKQLHALPAASGAEGSTTEDDTIIKNLQEQIQLSEQERVQAMDLWQTAAQELDRLQQAYQKSVSDGHIRHSEKQQLQDQLTQLEQHTWTFQSANHKLESSNQHFLQTVTQQSTEMEALHIQLRQTKTELRTATAKVEETTKLLQNVQGQMQRRDADVADARGREDAAEKRLHHLQAALSQLETRLKAATQEAEAVRREQAVWERKVGQLQARCTTLEEEKYEALSKVRESVQIAEEATLLKDQAQLGEKQTVEELLKTKEAIKQFIQDATVRTRKEVANAHQQCNLQIQRMAEELSALQLECADKEAQIERSLRERKAVEEELEKMYKEGRAEPDYGKMDVLHQRCLNAERSREDLSLTLQSTQNKLKKMEMNYSEELSRCQEEMRRLQGGLNAARDDSVSVSGERLQLQEENQRLHREMDELRKATTLVQRKAKQQVSQMEQEYSLKEQGLSTRLRELEESRHSSSADLTQLLTAQHKSTQRWKEEATNLVHTFEAKITALKAEVTRHKQRSQELELQIETDHNTISEYEKQLTVYQEKTKRLSQVDQKSSSSTQQYEKQLAVCQEKTKRLSQVD